jgi:hypothetical protein
MATRQNAAWTDEETNAFRVLKEKHGTKWTSISKKLNDLGIVKTPRQLSDKWKNSKPTRRDIVRCPWTTEEDFIILQGVHVHGRKWTEIEAQFLPYVAAEQIKYRYDHHLKKSSSNGSVKPPRARSAKATASTSQLMAKPRHKKKAAKSQRHHRNSRSTNKQATLILSDDDDDDEEEDTTDSDDYQPPGQHMSKKRGASCSSSSNGSKRGAKKQRTEQHQQQHERQEEQQQQPSPLVPAPIVLIMEDDLFILKGSDCDKDDDLEKYIAEASYSAHFDAAQFYYNIN